MWDLMEKDCEDELRWLYIAAAGLNCTAGTVDKAQLQYWQSISGLKILNSARFILLSYLQNFNCHPETFDSFT